VTEQPDDDVAEIGLLLEGIRRRYGYDFANYSFSSLHRRLRQVRDEAGCERYTELLDLVYHDGVSFDLLLRGLSITVTEMFRDPKFYAAVRAHVVPNLKTFPFAKIWHAGCATGQELYSMAILLQEESFLERVRLYGTDFNKHALDVAQKGVYPARDIEAYAANYSAAGGRGAFSDYFSAGYDFAKVKDYLKEQATFSYHNLVTDGVFGEMNMICCRNVLIYFDRKLQDRVLRIFADSLRHGGFLCLGNKETLNFTAVQKLFEPVDARQRIYRKTGE
jgi:chemotaxis protein methyltransferase CheR